MTLPQTGSRAQIPARVPDDWYVGFHRGLVARFGRAAGATMADDDARLVRRLLDVPSGGAVLDVPCGDGRLTTRLAAAGYVAVGVDIALAELARARHAAAHAGVEARFVAGDLRALPDIGLVDAVVSWGNSFGYLTPADTARSLAGIRPGAAAPGTPHPRIAHGRRVTAGRGGQATRRVGVRRRAHDHHELVSRRREPARERVRPPGRRRRVEHARGAHQVHTSGEVVRLLRTAGFRDVLLLGADGASPYELGAPRLIAVATA